jgi:hypothetical protein
VAGSARKVLRAPQELKAQLVRKDLLATMDQMVRKDLLAPQELKAQPVRKVLLATMDQMVRKVLRAPQDRLVRPVCPAPMDLRVPKGAPVRLGLLALMELRGRLAPQVLLARRD